VAQLIDDIFRGGETPDGIVECSVASICLLGHSLAWAVDVLLGRKRPNLPGPGCPRSVRVSTVTRVQTAQHNTKLAGPHHRHDLFFISVEYA
jgi:hypothetical protein